MFNKALKKITILVLVAVAFFATSLLAVKTIANAAPEVNESAILERLTPKRNTEYGNPVGNLIIIEEDNTVYQNYENGCVRATLVGSDNVMNKRDFGGVNYNESSEKLEFLKAGSDYKLKDLIMSRPVDGNDNVQEVWETLALKFNSTVEFDSDYALGKIYEKYADLCDKGYNCGIATSTLGVWDNSVIKLDFYDGDSEYGFGETDGRTHVTTIAYSFIRDEAFAIHDKIFDFYKDAKAGSLSEPITDLFEYKGEMVQAFALGYISYTENANDIKIHANYIWNWEDEKFEIQELTREQVTATDIVQTNLDDSPYYKGFTVDKIKDLFYAKYCELIDSGFNPGIPDHEGIYYWDTELIKQAYVGSDGTGNAWGRTNMMLILNPDTGKVHYVYNEILNIVDKSAHDLGTAQLLGYPMCDPTDVEINGLHYTYQNFNRSYFRQNAESVIYTINNSAMLTRHIVGGYFEDMVATGKKVSANNPMYFYVVEPWLIALICVLPFVLAGAGVAVFFVIKKKKAKALAAGSAVAESETIPEEQAGTETEAERGEE